MNRDGGSGWAVGAPGGQCVGSPCVDEDRLFSGNLNTT